MSDLLIHNVRLVEPGRDIQPGSLLIREGKIAAFGANVNVAPADATRIDGGSRLLTPGLIDAHISMVSASIYMNAARRKFMNGAEMLPRFGVTSVLPTLYRVMHRSSLETLGRACRDVVEDQGRAHAWVSSGRTIPRVARSRRGNDPRRLGFARRITRRLQRARSRDVDQSGHAEYFARDRTVVRAQDRAIHHAHARLNRTDVGRLESRCAARDAFL